MAVRGPFGSLYIYIYLTSISSHPLGSNPTSVFAPPIFFHCRSISTTNATYISCMFAYMFQWIQIELYKLEVPCRWKWRCLTAGQDQWHRRLWERPCPRGQAYDLYTAGTRRGAMKDNSSRPDMADPSWSMSYGGKSQLTPGCPSNHLINMWMHAMDNCSVI